MNYISQEHRYLVPKYKTSIAYTNIRILAAATVFLLILSIPYAFEPVPDSHPYPLLLESLAIISILLYFPQFIPLWPRFPKNLFQPLYTVLLFL